MLDFAAAIFIVVFIFYLNEKEKDHNVSDDQSLSDGHAAYGVMAESSGPAYFLGCAFEHHKKSAFNLTGASNCTCAQ